MLWLILNIEFGRTVTFLGHNDDIFHFHVLIGNLSTGKLPFSGKNLMSRQERNQYLPIMKALLKVMETSRPSPQDVNTLLKLSRDLAKNSPKGQFQIPLAGLGFGGFGIDDIESMGLPETGDIIKTVNGVPMIKTKFGKY